jgi:hypothetical protein
MPRGSVNAIASEATADSDGRKPDAPLTQMLSGDAKPGPNNGRHPRRLSLLWRDHGEGGVSASPPARIAGRLPEQVAAYLLG